MFFNHTCFSKDDKRFFVLSRSSVGGRLESAMYTASIDGTQIREAVPYGRGISHFDWKIGQEIIATFRDEGRRMRDYLLTTANRTSRSSAPTSFKETATVATRLTPTESCSTATTPKTRSKSCYCFTLQPARPTASADKKWANTCRVIRAAICTRAFPATANKSALIRLPPMAPGSFTLLTLSYRMSYDPPLYL